MVEQRVAAVLGGLGHQPVLLAAEREPVRPGDPVAQQPLDGGGHLAGVQVGVLAELELVVRAWTPRSRRARRASRGTRRRSRRPRSGARPGRAPPGRRPRRRDRRRAARERLSSKSARTSTSGSTWRCRPLTPSHGAAVTGLVRPRLVAEYSQPCGPEKSTSLRAASAGVEPLARLLVEHAPAGVADRRVSTKQMVHRCAPLRPPMPSDPSSKLPPAPAPPLLERLRLRLLAVLDDVTGLEQDPLRDLAPRRRAAQQELEIHREVLELLALGVLHHRDRLGVGLDRQALLIPADRLGLLGQRRAQARERPRRRRAARQAARGTDRSPSDLLIPLRLGFLNGPAA